MDNKEENPNKNNTHLADYLKRLNLSEPRHQSPDDSVLRRRVESAAKGQNGNFHGSTFDVQDNLKSSNNMINGQNGFLGRSEVPFGPSLDKKGFFGPSLDQKSTFGPDPMYVANGPSGAQNSSKPGPEYRDPPAQMEQNGKLNNGVLPFELDYDVQDNLKSCYNMINGQNGFSSQPDAPFRPSLDKKGFLGPDPMYVANGPSRAQLSSRPGLKYQDLQNGNLQHGVLPFDLDSAYDFQDNLKNCYNMINGQNGVSGRPDVPFGPSLDRKGFVGPDPMYVANGPSGAQNSTRPGSEYRDPPAQRGQNCNLNNGVLPFELDYDVQDNFKSCYNMIDRQNGFSGQPEVPFGLSLDKKGFFGPNPMYVANGSSRAQFSSRPGLEYQNLPVQWGQNGNLPRGVLPYEFGYTYDDHENLKSYYNMINRENEFSGRPEGSFEPSLDKNGFFGPNPMHAFNGPSRARLSSRPGLDFRNQPAQWGQNGNLEDGFLPFDQLGSTYCNPMNSQNGLMGRPGSEYNSKNRINGSSFSRGVSFEPSLDQDGLFGSDPMYVPNGPNLWPKKGLNRPVQLRPLYNQNGSGRDRSVDVERSNWPGTEYSKYQLKGFLGNIKVIAKNRECSGFLRRKIEDGAEEDLELIFEEVKDDVASLMVNYFGSSVVQKLFKVCRPEQISYILRSLVRLKFEFVEICCDHHGSVAMRKLLENLSTSDQRTSFISALSGVVLILSKDHNGLNVVKYCIDHFPENVDVLINEIADDGFAMATHKSGCCVLQPCLLRASRETMERLMNELAPNIVILSEHHYANYVIQSILDLNNPSITRNILGCLAGNYVYLSMNRCSSNVVEKCLLVTTEEEAREIIIEIMDSDNFDMVLKHPYGNYVVQKALEVSQKMESGEIQGRLENHIMEFYGSLFTHPYGNRVLAKLNHLPKRF